MISDEQDHIDSYDWSQAPRIERQNTPRAERERIEALWAAQIEGTWEPPADYQLQQLADDGGPAD